MKVRWLYFGFVGMMLLWGVWWLSFGGVKEEISLEERYSLGNITETPKIEISHTQLFQGPTLDSQFPPVRKAFNITTGKTFTIGIPFTFRAVGVGAEYLFRTVESVLRPLTPQQKADVQIIILNGEMNFLKHAHLFKLIREHFGKEVSEGTIVVYSMTPDVYPEPLVKDPCLLRGFKGDSLSRVRWTSKLAWDTITLLDIGKTRGKYYLHLEDDTPPTEGNWYDKTLALVESCQGALKNHQGCISSPWLLVFLNGVLPDRGLGGMFGLLFTASELAGMVPWMKDRYDLMPVDFLVGNYIFDHQKKTFTVADLIFYHEGKPKDSTKVGVDSKVKFGGFDEFLSWEQCPERKEMVLAEQRKG